MLITPPIDPVPPDLEQTLKARDISPAWLNRIDGDPYAGPAIARAEITRCATEIPWLYRHAVLDHDGIQAWTNELTGDAHRLRRPGCPPSIHHGRSLMLLGPTGVGKTYTAYATLRDLSVTGVRCGWVATTAADMYATLRPRHGADAEAEFKKFSTARFLFLDDLGASKESDWTEEINYRLFNWRHDHGLPTLITSNVPPKELGDRLGGRVASRLTSLCELIVLSGPDRRRRT